MSPPDPSSDPDREPNGLGGHAGERRRQFEEERGLSDQRELDLDEFDEDGEPNEDDEEPDEGGDEPEDD